MGGISRAWRQCNLCEEEDQHVNPQYLSIQKQTIDMDNMPFAHAYVTFFNLNHKFCVHYERVQVDWEKFMKDRQW